MIEVGDVIRVYNKRNDKIEPARVVDIRYNVKSSFDNHIYPALYDVYLFESHVMSNGHLPPFFDANNKPIFE
jgi:hypothetical protein